jgi:hypothetical protein
MALAMAVAANRPILMWGACGARRVVMYIDGDLPAETLQERVRTAMTIYGAAGIQFYAYNLDELDRNRRGFEPFTAEPGRA